MKRTTAPRPRPGLRLQGPALAGALLVVAACSQSPPPPPTSILLADTNRDGVLDDKDRTGKDAWSPTGGALFLANVDDDDSKGAADASDAIVNGPDDEKDLSRIRLLPWAAAPPTAVATLVVDGALAPANVNLFRHAASGWTLLSLPTTLAAADLATGIELGIEAKGFVQSPDAAAWDGYAVVHLVVSDPAHPQAGGAPLVDDTVKLRVAPYVMVNNLSPIFQLWNAAPGDPGGTAFHGDLTTLTAAGMVELDDANPPDPNGDQWDEDWWQIGITWMPAVGGGGVHGMRVGQRSAQPDRLAGGFAEMMLGPDFGFIWPHTDSQNGQSDPKGYSLDSFGDHDTLPPYTASDGTPYPLGRIIVGGTASVHIDPVVRAFYDAQRVQPVVQVDTTWLLVGHVDEIFSYVPAQTPRGWKLLVASPRLARSMLMDLVAKGQGSTKMFDKQVWISDTGKVSDATTTVSALLGDTEIMAASDTAQTKIDTALASLKSQVGLADDEVIEIPILFERVMTTESSAVDGYEFVAHMPGTVNLRATNGHLGIPNPHGPTVNGADYFQTDLLTRLGTRVNKLGADGMGLPITFVEDWDDYHIADGEVHCGTTTGVTTMPVVAWWEAGR